VVKDPREYLFNNRWPDDAVLQAAETAIREVVGKSKMDFVINEGRAEVAARAAKLMQEILDRYQTGVAISKVTMQNAQPPEQVQAAFDDAVKAGQDKERQKNEGQAYANDVVPRAQGTAARLLQEANGYKQSVIANAEGDASRFRQVLAEYAKAPGVTRERLYLDAMQQILSNSSKVLVDQKNGSNLLYLPLDKLIQKSAAEPAPAPATDAAPARVPAAGAEQGTPAPDYRSRDALRSRDREERP
jgi:membrane protease subunit HflK